MSTDAAWEKWGQQDPYFGVITSDKFRNAKLDESARSEFFESGKWHMDYIWASCRRYFAPDFAPRRVLDFGCGVGRLVVPMAALSEHVVGLDVSESMLREARRNCDAVALCNVTLAKSDDALTALLANSAGGKRFDLVHSTIVFQHIPQDRGQQIFTRLLECLAPGGIGAIQITYAKMAHSETWGQVPEQALTPVEPRAPERRRGILDIFSSVSGAAPASGGMAQGKISLSPPVQVSALSTVASDDMRSQQGDPEMQMNSYNLNHLLFAMQCSGITRFHTDFTDHGGELGVFLFFQKPPT